MNIFQKIGGGLANVGKWVADAVKDIVGLTLKIKTVLQQEKPLEKPFVDGLATVVGDVEQLVTLADTAVTADGMNFGADTAIYKQFLMLVSDFKDFAPVVEQAIAILKTQVDGSSTSTAS